MSYRSLFIKGLPWSLGTVTLFFSYKYFSSGRIEEPWWMYIVGFCLFVFGAGPLWVLVTKNISKNKTRFP